MPLCAEIELSSFSVSASRRHVDVSYSSPALPADDLKAKGKNQNLNGESYADVNTAINAAKIKAHKDDLILACGSVFLVGEVDI